MVSQGGCYQILLPRKAETYLYSPDGMNEIIAPIFLDFGRALGDIIVKIISHVKPRQNRPRNP